MNRAQFKARSANRTHNALSVSDEGAEARAAHSSVDCPKEMTLLDDWRRGFPLLAVGTADGENPRDLGAESTSLKTRQTTPMTQA